MLRKYIPGAPEFIEYTRELPKDSTSQKAKAKSAGTVTQATTVVEKAAETMTEGISKLAT